MVKQYTPPFEENIRTPVRFEQMWKHYDFRQARVLDLGCHSGEMCFRAAHWGADYVLGVNKDYDALYEGMENSAPFPIVHFWHGNINDFKNPQGFDVAMMLSVLGYIIEDFGLTRAGVLIDRLAENIPVIFIEVHLDGDGPGGFESQAHANHWLRGCGFDDVRAIATNKIPGRHAARPLFRCSRFPDPFQALQSIGRSAYRTSHHRVLFWKNDEQRPQEHLENAFEKLRAIRPRYVPRAIELGYNYLILEDLGDGEAVLSPITFAQHAPVLLEDLEEAKVVHGDLTGRNIIVRGNKPYAIDFFESRFEWEDRPNKRPEGDEYHLAGAIKGKIQDAQE